MMVKQHDQQTVWQWRLVKVRVLNTLFVIYLLKVGTSSCNPLYFFVDWVQLSKSQPTKLQYSIDLIVVFAIFAVVTTIFFSTIVFAMNY